MVQVSEFVRDARGPRHGADWARPQGEGGAQHRHPDVEPPRQHGVQGLMRCNLPCDQCLWIGQIRHRKIYQLISKSRLHLFVNVYLFYAKNPNRWAPKCNFLDYIRCCLLFTFSHVFFFCPFCVYGFCQLCFASSWTYIVVVVPSPWIVLILAPLLSHIYLRSTEHFWWED